MVKLSILFMLLFFTVSITTAYEPNKKYSLTFYHINDTHGAFYKSPVTGEGGFAILGTIIKEARKNADKSESLLFLTSGGDVNTGTPESDLLLAEPDFRSMKALKFDAMVLGNHEFDQPWPNLIKQHSWAQFPFLAANVHPVDNEPFPVLPFIIKEAKGLKIAFLGLITEHTKFLSAPDNVKGLVFDPAIETAKKWVPYLNKRADVVVVISHLGWCSLGKCHSPNDVLLAQSVPGIDLILGGHSHSSFSKPDFVNGTYIFQAFEKNQKLGAIKIEFLNDRVTLISSEQKPISGKEDPEILAIINPFLKLISSKLKKVIGTTTVYLDGERTNIRYTETTLGNLITKAMKVVTTTDFAIMNSGGIRSSISIGKISYGDVLKSLPFKNKVATVTMTGQEVIDYISKVIKMLPGEGNFPQMSGIQVIASKENKIIDIKINNLAVNKNKKYKLALNTYIAEGMELYPKVSHLKSYQETELTVDQVVVNFFKKNPSVKAKDVEITNYYKRLR